MIRFFTIVFFFIFSYAVDAQTVQETKPGKYDLFAFAGIGRATVQTNLSAPDNFSAGEFRLGVGLSRSISKAFELRSRLTFGGRLKRDAGPYALSDSRFNTIDENTSNRNHYFMELPLFLQFNLANPSIGFRAGGNYRQYFPASPTDAYSGQSEFGIITGIYCRLNDRINLGLDYYFGLTKMFNGGGISEGEEYNLIGRNHFAQLTFEIDL